MSRRQVLMLVAGLIGAAAVGLLLIIVLSWKRQRALDETLHCLNAAEEARIVAEASPFIRRLRRVQVLAGNNAVSTVPFLIEARLAIPIQTAPREGGLDEVAWRRVVLDIYDESPNQGGVPSVARNRERDPREYAQSAEYGILVLQWVCKTSGKRENHGVSLQMRVGESGNMVSVPLASGSFMRPHEGYWHHTAIEVRFIEDDALSDGIISSETVGARCVILMGRGVLKRRLLACVSCGAKEVSNILPVDVDAASDSISGTPIAVEVKSLSGDTHNRGSQETPAGERLRKAAVRRPSTYARIADTHSHR